MRERLRVDPGVAPLGVGLATIVVLFAIGAWLGADSSTDEVCTDPTAGRGVDVDCTAHHPGDPWGYHPPPPPRPPRGLLPPRQARPRRRRAHDGPLGPPARRRRHPGSARRRRAGR